MKTNQTNLDNKSSSQDPLRKKTLGFFEYLRALVQMRSAVVRDNHEYVDVLWGSEIPQQEGCYCAGWPQYKGTEDHVWIEIKKQTLPKIPKAPESCEAWVDQKAIRDPSTAPPLLNKIINPEWASLSMGERQNDGNDLLSEGQVEVLQYLELVNYPDVQIEWEQYVEKDWKSWANEYKAKKAVQDIYSRLFSMHQQQKALGESYEVVFGIGLLCWKTPSDQKVSRHIVTAQIEIDFDPNQGTISVHPSTEGAMPQFELDMLEANERPILEIYLQLQERLKEVSNEIWHNSLVPAILRSWVQALHSNGAYLDSWDAIRTFDADPKISFSPALILRKRTTRGFLKFIEQILEQVKGSEYPIPKTVRMYIDIDEEELEKAGDCLEGEHTSSGKDVDALSDSKIYFPLPANDEQREIIKKLGKHLGVLVQGPPGTGKSHTIANLICHLLATGKRVLVTSQTSRALKVLMDKLPERIRPLCVNLLGRGSSDVQSMERSVGEINRQHTLWDRFKAQTIIKSYEEDLDKTQRNIQEISLRMRELREAEIRKYNIVNNSYSGTAQEIANKIAAEEQKFGWIQDEVTIDQEQPISVSELIRLLLLTRQFTQSRIDELKKKRPLLNQLPSSERFVEMVQKRKVFKEQANKVYQQLEVLNLVNQLKKHPRDKRDSVIHTLNRFKLAKQEALKRPLPWMSNAVSQLIGEQDQPLRELESSTRSLLTGLKDKARVADESDIKWPSDSDLFKLKADAEDLCSHLQAGGNLGWGIFRSNKIKKLLYLTKNVFVDGRVCNSPPALEKLISCIGVEITLKYLTASWQAMIEKPVGTRFHCVAVYSEQHEALLVVLKLEDAIKELQQCLLALEDIVPPNLNNDQDINQLLGTLEAVKAIDELISTEQEFETVIKNLTVITTIPDHHPITDKLLKATLEDDWNLWGGSLTVLELLEKGQKECDEWLNLMRNFQNVLPLTATEFNETCESSVWDERFEKFEEVWKWVRADAWLTTYSDQHDEYELQKNYAYQDTKYKKLLEELAAEKAWTYCFNRLTERQRQHLMAWAVSIKKLGKGTGKYAEKHRRDAEANLRECQSAIPAWIMPLYRVVDTVKPQPEMFDVVIVDEASQCGSEALLLQYIAKQCIIVGDEEQIAPEAVGIDRNSVHLLIEQFLKDVPIKDSFDVESSLFTHAKIRYRNKVVLREHFRCVPEIIQFSNNLCYAPHGTSLIPLRQCPPNRLEPIKTVLVRDGYREGEAQNVINKPEAELIVQKLVECIKDKKYQGKTFGVVSLQGHNQSQYIEKKLIEEIGPEVMEERNIICGEPYDFQGDERDVMFISMVAATNERIGPLVKETDKRRFNVADSRAADQSWLFHSVTLADLNPNDYRYQLLSYYLNPHVEPIEVDGIEIEKLRVMKRNSDPPEPFDSWFEIDVFLQLHERGYRVIPQYRVANYKIDLVVEGMRGRLAVECDGDEWHGPEEYERDMARQRILERAKWTFWRIRGSSYYREPMQALDPLWQKLNEEGIRPAGASLGKKENEHEQERSQITSLRSNSNRILAPSFANSEQRISPLVNEDELLKFCQVQDNDKKLTPAIARSVLLQILSKEPSKGKDLLPRDALRTLGYTCRRTDRRKLERKIQHAIADLIREGKFEEYSTDKRKRVKLNKANPASLINLPSD